MFRNVTAINTILTKVTGAVGIEDGETGAYWSSSESSPYGSWGVIFSGGFVTKLIELESNRLRLVRAI